MIVKDFLLSLDLDKLSEVYYENHMSKDVYWRHAAQMLGVDLNKKSKQLLKGFIKQISELEPEVNKDKYLIVLKYFDFEYDDDFEMFKTEHYDASILHKNECKKQGQTTGKYSFAILGNYLSCPYDVRTPSDSYRRIFQHYRNKKCIFLCCEHRTYNIHSIFQRQKKCR